MKRQGAGRTGQSEAAVREERSVVYPEITLPFTLVKSARSTYEVSVERTGRVLLRVPFSAPEWLISRLLTQKKDWIIRHYLEAGKALEEEKLLKKEQAAEEEREAVKKLEKKFRAAARKRFEERAAYYLPFTGGSYKKICVRDQKTRWGSCSGRGTLSFNWRLILAPNRVLDYVVVHELCHLTHMNHSAEFWRAVERVMPDYKEQRTWLKIHGRELALPWKEEEADRIK